MCIKEVDLTKSLYMAHVICVALVGMLYNGWGERMFTQKERKNPSPTTWHKNHSRMEKG